MAVTIQVRRDTAAQWTSANPVLNQGEFGFEYDTGKLKMGNGSTAWTSLAYFTGLSLDATAADIQALGTQAAGSTGKAADAGHVHPLPVPGPWSALTLGTGITSTATSWQPGAASAPCVRQLPDGNFQLLGGITIATGTYAANAVLLTLPSGFYPQTTSYVALTLMQNTGNASAYSTAPAGGIPQLLIRNTGTITVQGTFTLTAGEQYGINAIYC